MSMILEALRKSEAERQRGRAPGLFVEQRPAPRRERSVPAWAWALGVLLVAVLLAWGWREWQRPAIVVVTAAGPSPDAVVEARPTQVAPRMEPAPVEPGSLAPLTLEPAATPRDVAAAPSPPPVATPRPPPPDVAPPLSEAIGAPAPAPAPAPPPAAPMAAAPAEPIATLPGLEALPASDRSALPPLKLSMHVYADTPAQRFVILDGQRLGEGASPASGVVLEEIRRDGLVLSVNGQRLLLARP